MYPVRVDNSVAYQGVQPQSLQIQPQVFSQVGLSVYKNHLANFFFSHFSDFVDFNSIIFL